jgi:hypothetical protein
MRVKLSMGCVPLTVLLLFLTAGPAWGQQSGERDHFLFKIGAAYDQGDFGTSETSRALFLPLTLRYLGERFDVSVTPSFALVNTSGGIRLIEGVPTPTGEGIAGVRDTRSGAGDTVIRGRVYLVNDAGPGSAIPSLTPFAKVKIPTAREEMNLGTGETDYGFGLEWDKQIAPVLLFGDFSYTVIGKVAGLDLRNRPGASFGIGGRLSNAVLLSGMIDWRRSIITGNDDLAELVGVVTFRLSPAVSFSPHTFVGLTSGSSDFGAGFEIAYRFGRY